MLCVAALPVRALRASLSADQLLGRRGHALCSCAHSTPTLPPLALQFAVFVIDFGSDNTILPLNTSEVVVIGVPTGRFPGEENTLTVRAATYGVTFPRLGFGPTITDVTVSMFNSPEGPNATRPHLELSIHPFSNLPRRLRLPWNTDIGCIAFSANIGSLVS